MHKIYGKNLFKKIKIKKKNEHVDTFIELLEFQSFMHC